MRDWKARLERRVRARDGLSESTRDCFPILPPNGIVWPDDIPDCPALREFYAHCNEGTFGSYVVSAATDLEDPSSEWLSGWAGLEQTPGRWIQFGNHPFGHDFLWDADSEEEPHRLKRTIAGFIEQLVFPSAQATEDEDDETNDLWIAARREAETQG